MIESRDTGRRPPAKGTDVNLILFLAGLILTVMPQGCGKPQALASPINATSSQSGPIDLTLGAAWEYRAVAGGREGSWRPSLQEAVAALGPPCPAIGWPRAWVTFIPSVTGGGRTGPSDDPASFAEVPQGMTLDGSSACRATLAVDSSGTLDLAAGHGEPLEGRWAYAFAQLDLAKDLDLVVRAAADGPMTWWAGGRKVFQSPPEVSASPPDVAAAARVHAFPLKLATGRCVLAVRVASGGLEWRLNSHAAPASGPSTAPAPIVQARCAFDAPDLSPFVSFTFVGAEAERAQINGQPIPLPLSRLRYERIVGVPHALLKPGRNELNRSWTAEEAHMLVAMDKARNAFPAGAARQSGRLLGLKAEAVDIQSGPVITRATETSLTVACRTNAPVPVVLRIDRREVRSEPGIIHRLSVEGLRAAVAYPYTLAPAHAGASASAAKGGTARTLPAAGPLTIGLVGDGRTSPVTWGKIARAVHEVRPDLVVYGGDLVADGLIESAWDREFFAPAVSLMANVPLYAVIGNHERRSPLFDRLFTDSLGGRNWAQEIAGVLLVGIDGMQNWAASGPDARWLDRTLAASKARFAFVVTHYPAFSSSTHGRLAEDGLPSESAARAAREQIYPILQRHRVAALIGGHDHCYERSEPPGGVTSITTAGAGAGLYGKREDPKQNPYSQVFARKHHYCVLRIEGDSCVLTATDLDGQTIDTKTWKAAERK